MNKSTLYFLVDSFGTSTQGRVYIGQTTDLLKRLDTHGKNKEFWDLALVFLTSNNSFNTAHIKYLEALCIEACKESGRYDVQQNSVRNFPVQQGLQAELDEYFRQISFYLRLVGYPMFDKVHLEVQEAITKLFCIHQLTETEAVGEYTDNGLVVLKGSTLVPTKFISDGTKLPSYMRRREELLDAGIIQMRNGKLEFVEDCLFNSPSAASSVILGYQSNGWVLWRNRDNVALSELGKPNEVVKSNNGN